VRQSSPVGRSADRLPRLTAFDRDQVARGVHTVRATVTTPALPSHLVVRQALSQLS
jgi:hypothetical protein